MLIQIRLRTTVLLLSYLISGCTTIDALRIVYGNDYSSHSWQQDQKQTTLPFEYLNQHIIIPVSIDGVTDLRMVLDTGAQVTVLFETNKTKSFLNRLNRKLSVGGIGDGDSTNAYFLHNSDITLGEVTISGLTTLFIKTTDNPVFTTQELSYADGVIGYDLFSRFVTNIDFTRNLVDISEAITVETQDYQRLPLNIENKLPFIDITVQNNQDSSIVPVMLDTGAVGSLIIDANQQISTGKFLYKSNVSGIGGESDVTFNRLEAIRVGKFEIPSVIAAISQSATTNIIGTGIINRFNLIVDYSSEQVLIKPNQYFYRPDYVSVFGATLLPHKEGAYIRNIRSGGSASQLGLKLSDVIVKVDGVDVNYQNFDAINEKLAQLPDKIEICYVRETITFCLVTNG